MRPRAHADGRRKKARCGVTPPLPRSEGDVRAPGVASSVSGAPRGLSNNSVSGGSSGGGGSGKAPAAPRSRGEAAAGGRADALPPGPRFAAAAASESLPWGMSHLSAGGHVLSSGAVSAALSAPSSGAAASAPGRAAASSAFGRGPHAGGGAGRDPDAAGHRWLSCSEEEEEADSFSSDDASEGRLGGWSGSALHAATPAASSAMHRRDGVGASRAAQEGHAMQPLTVGVGGDARNGRAAASGGASAVDAGAAGAVTGYAPPEAVISAIKHGMAVQLQMLTALPTWVYRPRSPADGEGGAAHDGSTGGSRGGSSKATAASSSSSSGAAAAAALEVHAGFKRTRAALEGVGSSSAANASPAASASASALAGADALLSYPLLLQLEGLGSSAVPSLFVEFGAPDASQAATAAPLLPRAVIANASMASLLGLHLAACVKCGSAEAACPACRRQGRLAAQASSGVVVAPPQSAEALTCLASLGALVVPPTQAPATSALSRKEGAKSTTPPLAAAASESSAAKRASQKGGGGAGHDGSSSGSGSSRGGAPTSASGAGSGLTPQPGEYFGAYVHPGDAGAYGDSLAGALLRREESRVVASKLRLCDAASRTSEWVRAKETCYFRYGQSGAVETLLVTLTELQPLPPGEAAPAPYSPCEHCLACGAGLQLSSRGAGPLHAGASSSGAASRGLLPLVVPSSSPLFAEPYLPTVPFFTGAGQSTLNASSIRATFMSKMDGSENGSGGGGGGHGGAGNSASVQALPMPPSSSSSSSSSSGEGAKSSSAAAAAAAVEGEGARPAGTRRASVSSTASASKEPATFMPVTLTFSSADGGGEGADGDMQRFVVLPTHLRFRAVAQKGQQGQHLHEAQ